MWIFLLFLFYRGSTEPNQQTGTTELHPIEIIGKKTSEETLGKTYLPFSAKENKSVRSQLFQVPSLLPTPEYKANVPPTFRIRGQDPIQNRIFLEGFSLSEAGLGESIEFQISKDSLAGIEVDPYQAPKQDGLGGSINYRLKADSKFSFAAETGSFERLKLFTKIPILKSGQFHFSFHRSNENFSYFDDNGTAYNRLDDTIQIRNHNGFRVGQGIFHWNTSLSKKHWLEALGVGEWGVNEVPGPIRSDLFGQLEEKKVLLGLKDFFYPNSGFSLTSQLFSKANLSQYQSVRPESIFKPATSSSYSFGGQSEAEVSISQNFSFKPFAGIQWEGYRIDLPAQFSSASYQEQLRFPFGASILWEPSFLKFHGSLVAGYYSYQGKGEGSFSAFRPELIAPKKIFLLSPRLQFEIPFADSVKLEGGGGFFNRAPSLQELYGSPRGILPASDLRPEEAWKYSIGVSAQIEKLQASTHFFYARNFGLIFYQVSGPGLFQADNIGDSEIWGVESRLSLKFSNGFSFSPQLVFMNSRNLSPLAVYLEKELPFRPRFRFQPEFSFEFQKILMRYWLTWNSKTFLDLENLIEQPEVFDHNLSVSANTSFGVWTLEALNLLDTLFVSGLVDGIPTAQLPSGAYGYPVPGRRISVLWKLDI